MAGSVDETPAGGHTAQDTDQTHDEAQNSTAGDPSASEAVTAAVEALGELATLTPPLIDDGSEGSDYELDDFGQIGVGELLLLQANLQHLKQKMRGEVQAAISKLLRPERVLLRDKVTFCLGIMHMLLSAYWLGFSPQSFYRLYTTEAGVLLLLRLISYRYARQHYYLLDWCYFGNALLVLHIWLYPTSVLLLKVVFAHAFGPLLWSILAFRNSIVPHSLDKMTSHFMHWFPACVCFAARWHPSDAMQARLRASPGARARWESTGWGELVLLPLLPYLAWAIFYYIKVFVVSSAKIQQKGYETLFQYSTSSRKSLFGAVVLRAPKHLRPLVYMSAHLLLTAVTMLLNTLWWRSFYACCAFMVAILTASAWSGATFYFDVFATRYIDSLRKRE